MPPKQQKWEESSSEEESSDDGAPQQPIVARRKFGDEEDSDDVADNWDEEEDSEVEREKAKKAAAAKAAADAEAAKNKKSKAQRVEEHRNAKQKQRDLDALDDSSDEDEADKRARLRQQEKDSDLKHASDLLGDVDLKQKRGTKAIVVQDAKNPGQAIDLSSIPLFKPSTKTQFEQLSETLVPLLRASSQAPHYTIFMQNFVKQICQDMPSTEIKKAASGLTALSNEKLKDEKAQQSGKKSKAVKTKTTLAAGRNIGQGKADLEAYDEGGLDDGDFM